MNFFLRGDHFQQFRGPWGPLIQKYLFWRNSAWGKTIYANLGRKLGKWEANPRGLADLEYEVIGIEWQQESLITNSNPDLLGNCGDFVTDLLTGVRTK